MGRNYLYSYLPKILLPPIGGTHCETVLILNKITFIIKKLKFLNITLTGWEHRREPNCENRSVFPVFGIPLNVVMKY